MAAAQLPHWKPCGWPDKTTNVNTIRSIKTMSMKSSLIAPCGMNCRLCRAYVREKKACPGCRGNDNLKSKSAAHCLIKHCEIRALKIKYCYDCEKYLCDRLRHLDKRYITKYGMSMIGNLENIK